jgi:ribose/xylose/arabinose/galactoside ABC-type transport system permease subunit
MKAKLEKSLRSDRPYMLYAAFISAVIFFSVASPVFLSSSNFVNIGRQTAIVTMLAVGMTFVVICAEIDLSIGSVLALSGMAAGLGMKYLGDFWAIGAICGIATGTLVGLINGVLTSRLRIPSFLVTLGMLGIARGIALMVTSTLPVVVINQPFIRLFGEGTLFGVPAPIAWTLVVIIVGYVILHKTVLGSLIYATGGNVVAAKYSGINTNAVKLLSFVSLGFLAGLAGLIFTARSHAARPDIGAGLELNVIAAVILGGTSLFGGRGTILGTLLGCVIVGILDNGLILLGVTSSTQLVVKGVIIIAAVAFSRK